MAAKYPQLRRTLLTPLAEDRGLDYDREQLDPGDSPTQNAFHFVACGCDLLGLYLDPKNFPATDRRTRRRGAKWVRECFARDDGRQAAVFLAQALAFLQYESMKRAGHPESAEAHLGFRKTIQEVYPLSADAIALLEGCRAEYAVMDTHEVSDNVRQGVESGSGYHQALLDPESGEGRNPDDDEDLVETQLSYAARYLRRMAGIRAVEMTVGDERFASIEDKVLFPGGLEPQALIDDAADSEWWTDVMEAWHTAALRALEDPLGR